MWLALGTIDDGAKQWFKIVMNDYVFLYDGTTPLRAPVQFSYEYRNEYLINNNNNAKPRGITAVAVNNPELTVGELDGEEEPER